MLKTLKNAGGTTTKGEIYPLKIKGKKHKKIKSKGYSK